MLKDQQYVKFSAYGFLKNLRFFDAFILLFFRETGMSFFQIGILFSIREIARAVMEIPSGVLADWFGRKRVMILCFLSYIISFIIFYFFPYFTIYIIAMLFFAGGEAARSGTHKAMIFKYLRIKGIYDQKTEYYGHTRAWSKRGSALSSLLAGGLVFYTGEYKTIFLATIVPYIVELFLMMSYPDELDQTESSRSRVTTGIDLKKTFRFFKNPANRRGLLNSALYDSYFKAVKDYLQPILQTFAATLPILAQFTAKQKSAVTIAVIYFILFLLTSFASQNAGRMNRAFKEQSQGLNLLFIVGIGLTMLSGASYHFEWFALSIPFFICLYVVQNIRRPMAVSYISDTIEDDVMATALSVESQLKTIFIAIFAPIVGAIADLIGVGAAIGTVAAIILFFFPVYKVNPQE